MALEKFLAFPQPRDEVTNRFYTPAPTVTLSMRNNQEALIRSFANGLEDLSERQYAQARAAQIAHGAEPQPGMSDTFGVSPERAITLENSIKEIGSEWH